MAGFFIAKTGGYHIQDIFQSLKFIPIQDLAAHYLGLELEKKGKNNVGLCPFHQDKKPSFTVFTDNRWKCWGCGASGDGVDLVSRALNLSLKEAAFLIARDFGLHIDDKPTAQETKGKIEQIKQDRQIMERFSEWENRTFKGLTLIIDLATRFYLKGRRIVPDMKWHVNLNQRLNTYSRFLKKIPKIYFYFMNGVMQYE